VPSGARTARDDRRRSDGQNFLVDQALVRRLVDSLDITVRELVVDIGAGSGALTFACAAAGADVIAIERDPVWARDLAGEVRDRGLTHRIEVVTADALTWPLPDEPFRVVANPPFGMSTDLLARLLDDPIHAPDRCDLVLQLDVVRKRSRTPPDTLRSAAWAPWWTFDAGPTIPRTAFRPVPRVDAALLTIHRRTPAILPQWLAPRFTESLRPAWERGPRRSGR
jgi:23S rRNA (adenine-N6)-dimethyltransferase